MFSIHVLLDRLTKIVLLAVIVGLTALAIVGIRSWLVSRDALAQLAATVAAEKQVVSRAVTDEQQRNATLAKTLAAISLAKYWS